MIEWGETLDDFNEEQANIYLVRMPSLRIELVAVTKAKICIIPQIQRLKHSR